MKPQNSKVKGKIGILHFAFCVLAYAALPALDTVYFYYAEQDYARAYHLLLQLDAQVTSPPEKFLVQLELGDYYLGKANGYPKAESIYQQLITNFPKHPRTPELLYRLALSQELQEKFFNAAKSYEQLATHYFKSPYGQEALDAIERCFTKNYQDRVAYVNGYPITRIELDERISRNPAAYEPFTKKQELLDTMVNNRLLYEAAITEGLSANPQIVENLKETRNRAMFQVWYERYVTGKAEPSEKELRGYYKKNQSKYITPEKVHAYQLMVTAKSLAESLRAILIADTTKWDTIVKLHSIAPDKERGGDMGVFARGVHPKKIEAIAFKLKPGEVSLPIALKDTFVLIRVAEKKPREVRTFDEVKNQIAVELRQTRTSQLFEQEITRLKKLSAIQQDTLAIDQNRETLAVVNGVPITRAHLEARLNAIPPFFRGQFETPEGKRQLLDQLITEKLLLKECEKEKIWLTNRVFDQLLSRRSAMLIDLYRRQNTSEKVQLDSATLYAEYKRTIKEFKEPTRVRCRELVTKSKNRCEQIRNWAVNGRIPTMIHGVALLTPDSAKAAEIAALLTQTTNTDSTVALGALAGPDVRIPRTPTHTIGGKDIPSLTQPCPIAGPFVQSDFFSFAFSDLFPEDPLYQPEPVSIQTPEDLTRLLPPDAKPDSIRLGTYFKLSKTLPVTFVKSLFKLNAGGVSKPYPIPGGYLVVQITRKDTAQKADFAELVRRFSVSGSKWGGGEIALTPDDKARDPKVVGAAYRLTKGAISPVIKLNDTTYTILKMEEKKPAYTRSFSEVRSKIENRLRREKEKELYDQLIKNLRAQAKIEILLREEDLKTEEPETVLEEER